MKKIKLINSSDINYEIQAKNKILFRVVNKDNKSNLMIFHDQCLKMRGIFMACCGASLGGCGMLSTNSGIAINWAKMDS